MIKLRKPRKWLLIVLATSLIFPYPSLAKRGAPSPDAKIRVFSEKNRFHLHVCDPKCQPFGNPSGYTREQLEDWKKFRQTEWKDALPYFGAVGGAAMIITFLGLAPAAGLAALAAGVVALVSYGHSRNPQIQAGMTNEIYGEFSARPELIKELEKFLADVDKGESSMLYSPRVLTSPQRPKQVMNPEKHHLAPTSQPAE